MDKGCRTQADEFLTGIAMHRACRGIGLDHATDLHIVDDQPIAGGPKDAPIGPFFAHMDSEKLNTYRPLPGGCGYHLLLQDAAWFGNINRFARDRCIEHIGVQINALGQPMVRVSG
jgi:hypothetical protein